MDEKIFTRILKDDTPPLVIAELSANHCGDFEKAKVLVQTAVECGVDAVKLQTYRADTLTVESEDDFFYIKKGAWSGRYMHELYREGELDWPLQRRLFDYCNQLGVPVFSTPFDATAVDFLEECHCPVYKIASPEICDFPLLAKVAITGKPVILSTGYARLGDIERAVNVLKDNGAGRIALLHCIPEYPTAPERACLKAIPYLREVFRLPVGLSDHSLGTSIAVASVALGARIIEKHFVLHRGDPSIDAFFSATPDEMARLVTGVREVFQALQDEDYISRHVEEQKSLVVVKPIKRGERFDADNVRVLRPGGGLSPRYYDLVLQRVAARDLEAGRPLGWEDIGNAHECS